MASQNTNGQPRQNGRGTMELKVVSRTSLSGYSRCQRCPLVSGGSVAHVEHSWVKEQ